MDMIIGPFVFRRGLWETIAAIVVIAVFVRLGVWQLHRAEQKAQLQAAIDDHKHLPAIALTGDSQFSPESRFRRVVVRGRFDPDKQVLSDNQVLRSQAGVRVLTPLRIANSGRYVLVDRGWIAFGPNREIPGLQTARGGGRSQRFHRHAAW